MAPKKIIIHDFASHAFVFQLSKELAKNDIEVFHLYSTFFQSPNRGYLKNENSRNLKLIEIKIKGSYSKTNFIKRRILDIAYGKVLSEKIREIEPDIFINCVCPLDTSKIIQHTCESESIKYYTWLQDIYSIATKAVLSKKIFILGKLIGSYYQQIEKKLFIKSEHIISITNDFIPILNKLGVNKEKITVIPNWANVSELSVREKDNEWSAKFNLRNTFNFLYSGTLGFKHNPSLLSKLALKFKNYSDVKVIVISEGQGADWLRKEKIEKEIGNLLIMDYQPYEQLPNIFGTADVLISILDENASIYSVPSKVMSYICAKRPILLAVPQKNLAAKIVNDNKLGEVVSPKNFDPFFDASLELYNNQVKRETYGNNARNYATRNFNIENIKDSFLGLINKT